MTLLHWITVDHRLCVYMAEDMGICCVQAVQLQPLSQPSSTEHTSVHPPCLATADAVHIQLMDSWEWGAQAASAPGLLPQLHRLLQCNTQGAI